MTWRSRLRTPSWRGVPFHVQGSDLEGGRRLAVHEYPQQDKPYAEDMGRKGRRVSLSCFVLGDDYFAIRDLLLEALEAPGPGVLVHPYYGELTCNVDTYSVREDIDTGRLAAIDVTWVESGEHEFPVSFLNPASAVSGAGTLAKLAAAEDFAATWSVSGAAWLVTAAADAITEAVDAIRDAVLSPLGDTLDDLGTINNALDAIEDAAADLAATPADLLTQVQGVFDAVFAIGPNAADVFEALTRVAGADDSGPTGETASAEQAADNQTALDRLIIRTCLAEWAAIAAITTYDSYDDAIAARDLIAERTAAEAEAAPPGDVHDALTDLRTRSVDDLTQRAEVLARLRDWTPADVMPACVLAHDLYGDATRGAEIATRNDLPHPGLVPVQVLRVLAA